MPAYKSEKKRRAAAMPTGRRLTLADVNEYVKRKKRWKK
jgi:hypothetical protein